MKKSLWIQSVRRNVYYWSRAVEGIILVFICIDLCYAALFGMTGQEASESIRQTGVMRLMLENARNYMIGMGLMMPMVIPASYGKNGIGLTISFGGKRSETVWGVQFMHLLVIVQVTLYVALLNLLLEGSWIWFPLYFAGMLTSAALGQLLLCAQLRFGTKGIVFTVLAITAAAITAIFLLAAGNGVSFLSAAVLLPVMNLFLGLSLVSAVSPEIRLDSLCAVFAKSVRWVLGLVVSIFCSLLTAQTMIASSADGAAVKAGKMLVGFVPVVGSAIGDAMAAVQGCLKLVKSGVGGFALVAALCLFLPVILQCLLWILCCTVCAAAGDLLGLSEISGVLRASGQVLQTLLAILISCLVILIVSGVLMMQ